MAVLGYKWLMVSLLGFFHPFFVGVTEIQQNAKEKTLEISIKLFIDDFETALAKGSPTAVDLSTPKDAAKANQLVLIYLQQHFKLKLNGQPVTFQFIGYEKEREAAWCYAQVNNVESVSKLEIDNSLLYDSFDKQINLMHVTVNGSRQSTKIAYPEQKAVFNF